MLKRPKKIFGVKIKDKTQLMNSQSGGAFIAIATYFLKNGAIVYGCGMIDNVATYLRIDNLDDIKRIQGSKYVQATLGNTFENIKLDLDAGKTVLFSGTPCYVNGVIELFSKNKNRDNLYTVDLICHGVPSPLVYDKYKKELEKENNSSIREFIFREKTGGGVAHPYGENNI